MKKPHIPCGQTLGHGEKCIDGHLCDQCNYIFSLQNQIHKIDWVYTQVQENVGYEFGCAKRDVVIEQEVLVFVNDKNARFPYGIAKVIEIPEDERYGTKYEIVKLF